MKLRIDKLDSITGWSINSPSTLSENEHKQYIAGYDNSKSVVLNFSENDTVRVASKTFTAVDVTDYNTLILSVWSTGKSNHLYRKSSDFSYKIKINATKEYYLQAYSTFTNVNVGIEEVTQIDRIEITALHSDSDSLVISEMVVETEEVGIDVLKAVKEQIEHELNQAYGNGLNIGTGSGVVDQTFLTIPNYPKHIDRYSVIKIDDNTNSEIHQIDDNNAEIYNLNDNYDGKALLNSYTNANIYLQFPVYINPGQLAVRLPGIAIWGLDPDPVLRGSKLDILTDTYRVTEDDFKERLDGQILEYTVLLDIEARGAEVREMMARVIRKWIAKEILWINGRYHEIYFESKPTEIRGLEGVDIIPKIQYTLRVEVREDLYSRDIIPKTTDINIDVDVQQ